MEWPQFCIRERKKKAPELGNTKIKSSQDEMTGLLGMTPEIFSNKFSLLKIKEKLEQSKNLKLTNIKFQGENYS